MTELRVVFPGVAVSVNRTWRGSSTVARPYTSQATTAARKRAGLMLASAMLDYAHKNGTPWPLLKWFGTRIILWNARADLDNLLKVALDCLQGMVVQNDRYHLDTHTQKKWDDGEPRIEIVVFAVDPTDYGRIPGRVDGDVDRGGAVPRKKSAPRARSVRKSVPRLRP